MPRRHCGPDRVGPRRETSARPQASRRRAAVARWQGGDDHDADRPLRRGQECHGRRHAPRGGGGGQTWPITLDGSALVVEPVPYAGRLWGTPEASEWTGSSGNSSSRPATTPTNQCAARRDGRPRHSPFGDGVNHRHAFVPCCGKSQRHRSEAERSAGVPWHDPRWCCVGRGRAAASQTTLAWRIYGLEVDGAPAAHGSLGRWMAGPEQPAYPPGGFLPDRDTLD